MTESTQPPAADDPSHPDHPARTVSPTPAGAGTLSQTRYEHYEIQRREDGSLWTLGAGAMGATYKAFDTRLHCIVALKVVHSALLGKHPVLRERFLREARAAASVRHPNIASVFHLGEDAEGQCFYAMEFIDGETVAERVRRRGPLPPLQALEIAAQVTHALVISGQADLIHRDIKPSNVMLTSHGLSEPVAERASSGGGSDSGGSLLVKVIDFGLVRTIKPDAGNSLTVAGDFVGTPHYASPEQLAGDDERIDIRSDIYSLGSTLWFMLTGRQPFAGGSFEEIEKLQRRALPVEQLREADVPGPLVTLLKLMLAANPNRRPQTPVMLAESINECRQELLIAMRANGDGSTVGGPGRPLVSKIEPTWRTWLTLGIAALTLLALLAAVSLAWTHRHAPPARAAGPIPEKSIAVLPFANLSTDKDNAFFTDGVQDEILTDLAKVADLKVISRSSVTQYKSDAPRNLREIAAQLGVANVLEGSVQRAGNQVRVTAQLINARTDAHLWAEHYDRPINDVFAIQSDIAQSIVNQLRARLSPQEKDAINERPTADLPAYDLYLRAQSLYAGTTDRVVSQTAMPQAVRVLDEAVTRDPKFLSAWCLLATIHSDIYLHGVDHTPARLELAKAALQRAVRLQPDAGETHLAVANYYYSGFRDYDRARVELDLARRTLPNNAEVYESIGYADRRQSRWAEAVRNMEHAIELDPRNFYMLQQTALTYGFLRRWDDATRLLKRSLEVLPGDPYTRLSLEHVKIDSQADIQPFQATLAALLKEDPTLGPQLDDPLYSLCERTPAAAARVLANFPREGSPVHGILLPYAFVEGVIARWERDAPRARAAFTSARADLAKMVADQPDLAAAISFLGLTDAGLGRKEDAIREGRRACELLPTNKDALDGSFLAANLAQIDAWTGDKKAAVEQIALIEQSPNLLSYGQLKLHPEWDDLRGDPGFEALVASLAPK